MKNPKWHRDEIILALDLYFKLRPGQIQAKNPEIIELSELLNNLPIHENMPNSIKFRNPNGVSLKLSNFLALDPDYQGVGMKSFSKLDEATFKEFTKNRDKLKALASQIKKIVLNPQLNQLLYRIDNIDIPPAKEGAVIYKLHRHIERNQSIVKKKKENYFNTHNKLECQICSFNFHETYKELGLGFIECHHIKALSELDAESLTSLEDLILVCANCHRMLHRKTEKITVEELKNIVAQNERNSTP